MAGECSVLGKSVLRATAKEVERVVNGGGDPAYSARFGDRPRRLRPCREPNHGCPVSPNRTLMSQFQNRRRGAIRAGLVILAGLVLAVLAGGGCVAGRYNKMIDGQETVDQRFSEIDNQYKRRNDLIPQLVTTVQGAADFEEGVLTDVAEARASVGRMQIPAQASANPEAVEQYIQAQQGLGAAVGRLLMTTENYPTLQATSGFRDLQTQVEGTENRIAVARRDYIDAIKGYNTTLRQFPGTLIAGAFGFERMEQMEAATPTEREAPTIDFGGDE